LQIASFGGQADIVKLLLDRGHSPLIFNKKKEKAVHAAATKGSLDSLKFLLEADKSDKFEANVDGQTLLHLASKGGHLDCIKLILEDGRVVEKVMDGTNQDAESLAANEECKELFRMRRLLAMKERLDQAFIKE